MHFSNKHCAAIFLLAFLSYIFTQTWKRKRVILIDYHCIDLIDNHKTLHFFFFFFLKHRRMKASGIIQCCTRTFAVNERFVSIAFASKMNGRYFRMVSNNETTRCSNWKLVEYTYLFMFVNLHLYFTWYIHEKDMHIQVHEHICLLTSYICLSCSS